MKIVFQKVPEWEGTPHAEVELAQRMVKACENIGHNALASSDVKEINQFKPDVVFPLFFSIPKLFDAFTIGCMWNPASMVRDFRNWDNIKSYDGYGVASESQEQLVKRLKFKSPASYLLTKIFPSTNTTVFHEPNRFDRPVYIGSNWSKNRHKDFFKQVKNIHVYGPENRWLSLAKNSDIYQGPIPCDGYSCLKIYREAGIGLAFHHESHNLEAIPSMRPFEIAASGAVMISDNNMFIKNTFGDNVLYIDTSLSTKDVISQLELHVKWIKMNSRQAKEMALACYTIFKNNFCLEVLINNVLKDVHEHKNNVKRTTKVIKESAEILIRSDGQDRKRLFRAIDSIKRQTYDNVIVHIQYRGSAASLKGFKDRIEQEFGQINIRYSIDSSKLDRGYQFFTCIRSSSAEYIGFLDHDDVLFEDHIEVLINILTLNKNFAIAYGGSVQVWEEGNPPEGFKVRALAYFHDMDGFSSKAFITSNSYLVRRELIPWSVLNQPIPSMDCREDRLFLQLMYRNGLKFIFSEKVTNAFFWRTSREGHSGETEIALSEGKNNSEMVLRSSNFPWIHPEQMPSQQYFISLDLIKRFCNSIRHDFLRIIFLIATYLKHFTSSKKKA